MSSARSDGGATAAAERDDGAILVLKVWREPGFRARITVDCPGSADPSAQTVLATTETAVIEYVRDWLHGAAST